MLNQGQLEICNELVELYKAQIPFVDQEVGHQWTTVDREGFDRRAERIANLQRQLVSPVSGNPVALRVTRPIVLGSWQDR